MKLLKLTFLATTLIATLAFTFSLATASLAFADAKKDVCAGIGLASDGEGCETPEGAPDANSVIEDVINILSIVVGVAAVIMIVIGGFKFVTSGGDAAQTTSARNTIIYAVVGLVVVAVAQILVKFVVNKVT